MGGVFGVTPRPARRVRRRPACATRRSTRPSSSAARRRSDDRDDPGRRAPVRRLPARRRRRDLQQAREVALHARRQVRAARGASPADRRSSAAAGAEHSQCLEAMAMHVPGLKVVLPATPADAKGLLKTAIRDPNPVLFLRAQGAVPGQGRGADERRLLVPFGEAAVRRRGDDATVVATGADGRPGARGGGEARRATESSSRSSTRAPSSPSTWRRSAPRSSARPRPRRPRGRPHRRRRAPRSRRRIQERAFFALDAPVGRLAGTDTHLTDRARTTLHSKHRLDRP